MSSSPDLYNITWEQFVPLPQSACNDDFKDWRQHGFHCVVNTMLDAWRAAASCRLSCIAALQHPDLSHEERMCVSQSIDVSTDACEDIGSAVYAMLGYWPFTFETAEPLGFPEESTEKQYEMRIEQIQPVLCPPLAQGTSTQYDPLDDGLPTTTTSPPPPHHENSTLDEGLPTTTTSPPPPHHENSTLDEGLPTTTTSPPPPHHENSTPDDLSVRLEAVYVAPRRRDLPRTKSYAQPKILQIQGPPPRRTRRRTRREKQPKMPKILPPTPPPTPTVEDLIHIDWESSILGLPRLRPKILPPTPPPTPTVEDLVHIDWKSSILGLRRLQPKTPGQADEA